jgi:hypothetical protein
MQIAKYPAPLIGALNNLPNRAFISKISYVEAFWYATQKQFDAATSIFKVGDAALNNFC